nr:MAG TPA: PROTEIN (ACTIN), ACTIN, GELSOLIN, CONTRACTILE PROTEIN [Caudoviricetes sp.]
MHLHSHFFDINSYVVKHDYMYIAKERRVILFYPKGRQCRKTMR